MYFLYTQGRPTLLIKLSIIYQKMLSHNEILYVDKLISASTFIILIIENCSRIIGIVIEFIILKPLIKFLYLNACVSSMIIFSNNMRERSVLFTFCSRALARMPLRANVSILILHLFDCNSSLGKR